MIHPYYSTYLFLFNFVYALGSKQTDVALGCLICFVIGSINHQLESKVLRYRVLDILVVNSIATLFLYNLLRQVPIHVLLKEQYIFSSSVIACALLAISMYLIMIRTGKSDYHMVVHLIANLGIAFYVTAVNKKEIEGLMTI